MPQCDKPQSVSSQIRNSQSPPAGLTDACQLPLGFCWRRELAKLPSPWQQVLQTHYLNAASEINKVARSSDGSGIQGVGQWFSTLWRQTLGWRVVLTAGPSASCFFAWECSRNIFKPNANCFPRESLPSTFFFPHKRSYLVITMTWKVTCYNNLKDDVRESSWKLMQSYGSSLGMILSDGLYLFQHKPASCGAKQGEQNWLFLCPTSALDQRTKQANHISLTLLVIQCPTTHQSPSMIVGMAL